MAGGASRIAGLALALTLTPAAAGAQTTTTPLIIDRDRLDRAPAAAAPTPPDQRPRETTQRGVVASAGQGVIIRGVAFDGTKVPARVAAAAKPFLGRIADRPTLDRLAAALAKAYAKTDVALYTLLIPDQTFAGGVVHIVAIEGSIEKVRVDIAGRPSSRVEAYAAKLEGERPLSRTRLERQISLMRDLPGFRLSPSLLPGDETGSAKMAITGTRRKPEVRFAYDNRATLILGDGQVQATARAYNLIGDGSDTSLVLAAAPDLRRYRYAGLAQGIAIDGDGFRLSLSAGTLRTRPEKSPIEGSAKLAGITASYPLVRGYQRTVTASLSLDGLNSDNAAFGALITSERTRALRGAIQLSDSNARRSIVLGATASQGLDIWGARAGLTLADTRFAKLNGTAAINQAIGKRLVARVRASGQYSKDPLPAAERFTVGGADYGRGFEIALLSADRGIAGSAELAWRPITKGKLRGSELYSFVDKAKVTFVPRGWYGKETYGLASAGGGVRVNVGDRASASVELAHAIQRPYPGYDAKWQVSVGWSLSLFR